MTAIGKYSFSTDGNSTNVGTLTVARDRGAGASSDTYSYSAGGAVPNANTIDKMSFSAEGSSSDVGDLTNDGSWAGQHSATHGYASGVKSYAIPASTVLNRINKYSFSTDGNATNIGDLTVARYDGAGNSTETHGYMIGGADAIPSTNNQQNTIDKWSFSSDGNAVDVGDLFEGFNGNTGTSSDTHGYSFTGRGADNNYSDHIAKYSFASGGNAADIANATVATQGNCGSSSRTYGYTAGGEGPTNNIIQKHSFSTDSNATDVGDTPTTFFGAMGSEI